MWYKGVALRRMAPVTGVMVELGVFTRVCK